MKIVKCCVNIGCFNSHYIGNFAYMASIGSVNKIELTLVEPKIFEFQIYLLMAYPLYNLQ